MKHKVLAFGIIFIFVFLSVGSFEKEALDNSIKPVDGPMDSPWPMFAHNQQRTGHSPYAPSGNWAIEKWKFWMDGMTISSPAIDENGTIYTGSSSDRCLFALHSNGTEKWRFYTGAYVLSSPAIDEDGIIYVGANNGKLFAIYPNGTQKWMYHVGSGWVKSSPVIDNNGIIYAASSDGHNVVAVYPNGTKKWDFIAEDRIFCSPSIDYDGIVYIGSNDGYMYALYPNGTLKWKYYAGGSKGIGSAPTIADNGNVYFGCTNGYLYCLYPNGTLNWRVDTGYNGASSPAIAEDGTIYVGSSSFHIYSINPDGTENWSFNTGDDVFASPVIDNNEIVYCGSMNGYFYALNSDGSLRWKKCFGDKVESSAAIGEDGTIYVGISYLPDPDFYSYLYAIEIIENDSPAKPTITGETQGHFGESYDYTFISTDPEGSELRYYIEWGDGEIEEWIGPFESGEEVVVGHTWDDQDTYMIQAKAKDEFDAESDWAYLEVTMPVNQHSYSFPLLQRLLERFPNAFPILRQLFF